MKQYISKDALVAEIEERINRNNEKAASYSGGSEHDYLYRVEERVYKSLLSFINTLEAKEVDLEKEIDNIWNPRFNLGWDEKSLLSMNHAGFTTIAKHFFELGMTVSNKTQKGE